MENSIAPESPAVARSRRKLAELFTAEKKEATPQRLQEVKRLIAAEMARTGESRVPVPGKEGMGLFANGRVAPLKVSAQVKRVMEAVSSAFKATPPVAKNG